LKQTKNAFGRTEGIINLVNYSFLGMVQGIQMDWGMRAENFGGMGRVVLFLAPVMVLHVYLKFPNSIQLNWVEKETLS